MPAETVIPRPADPSGLVLRRLPEAVRSSSPDPPGGQLWKAPRARHGWLP
jgi:hypothetical protein